MTFKNSYNSIYFFPLIYHKKSKNQINRKDIASFKNIFQNYFSTIINIRQRFLIKLQSFVIFYIKFSWLNIFNLMIIKIKFRKISSVKNIIIIFFKFCIFKNIYVLLKIQFNHFLNKLSLINPLIFKNVNQFDS
jgi:hypothetical protein